MNSIRYSRARRSGGSDINMAPLIDMIFILLIFFLVTTSFTKESGVDVERPVAASAQLKEQTNMIIGIDQDGLVHIENRVVDVRSVRAVMERFLAEIPEGSVVIAADKASVTGVVISVLDACRMAGVKHVSVAARQP
jgi:biopolymer transport protein ExbD